MALLTIGDPSIRKVAHWDLDERFGSTAYDDVGNNNGTIYGAKRVDGIGGGALSFDGSGDYVRVRDNDALDFGTKDFSISFEIETTNRSQLDVILDKRVEQSGAVQGYVVYNYYGKLGFQLADGKGWTNYISNISIADGESRSVTVSIDRDNTTGGKWYVDGELAGTFNPTGRQGSLSNNKDLTLGRRSDSSSAGYLNGTLGDVQLFNYAVNDRQAEAIDLKTVASWDFDERFGSTAFDDIGNNNGAIYGARRVGGTGGGALSFDGSGDYVRVRDNDALDFGTGDFSISFEIETTNRSQLDVILDKRVEQSGPTQGYVVYNYYGKLGFQLADGAGWTNYVSNISIADGESHHVAVTIDRDELTGGKWYVDGDLAGTFNPTGRQGSVSNNKDLIIGNRSDSSWSGYFNGTLDEVELFDQALDASDVKDLYQAGMGNIVNEISGSKDIISGDDELIRNDLITPTSLTDYAIR